MPKQIKLAFELIDMETNIPLFEKKQILLDFDDERVREAHSLPALYEKLCDMPKLSDMSKSDEAAWLNVFQVKEDAQTPTKEICTACADIITRFIWPHVIEFLGGVGFVKLYEEQIEAFAKHNQKTRQN